MAVEPDAVFVPKTPHELNALGNVTPVMAARITGISYRTIKERIAAGELPTVNVLGVERVDPLVCWAALQGATKKTLLSVVDARQSGKGVDDIITLVREGIRAQPPPVKKPRGANKKKAQAGGGT